MCVIHVISGNAGGSFSAGENIADKHEKIYCKSSGLFGLLRSFLLSLRLHFSPCGIVHFHDALPGYFYTLLPHSKKVVYTSHGHWSGFFAALPPKGFFQRLKSLLLVHTQDKLIERSDAVVAVSKKVEGIIKKGTCQKNVSVIYNGVDLKLFSAGRGEKVANNALWVGDNPEMKGLQKAIKIAQGKRMKLLVVGIDGKSTPEIQFLGKIPHKDMPGIYARCSLLIYPSEWDGHPLVPLEAMASGLAVVASKNCNLEIAPLKGGWYRISAGAARKLVKKYDWSEIRKQYQKLYESLDYSEPT